MNRLTRRQAIQCSLAGLGTLAFPFESLATATSPCFEGSFHYDHVIGTSLDVWLATAREIDVVIAEQTILDEIERLRLVFSTFDSSSEISWLNRTTGAVSVSPELLDVLRAYELWQQRSHGALNGRLGELVRVWNEAEATGVEPCPGKLANLVGRIAEPGWSIDDATGRVTRLSEQPLNLNSIAKGFIIERAFARVRKTLPSLQGLLLNLGGDMRIWRLSGTWRIGVQDPHLPFDNAKPLTILSVRDAAVATSGGYLRGYTIGNRSASHLFDPRTGASVNHIASATVIAADNITANGLATALCVMPASEGLQLVGSTPGAECLIVTSDRVQLRSAGWRAFEIDLQPVDALCASVAAWPEQFQVTIGVELPMLASAKYRRPYVAVWVEDSQGKAVRTLGVWGNSPKYLRDLSFWWKFAQTNQNLIRAVTRATRAPGKYDLVWDGKDDAGTAVQQGTYTIKVEVHREHGKHLLQSGKIACNDAANKTTLAKNDETGTTTIEYGKKK